MMTYLDELLYKLTRTFDRVVLQGHVTNESHYMSTNRVSIATKLDRIVTYLNDFLMIHSLDPLIMWSC